MVKCDHTHVWHVNMCMYMRHTCPCECMCVVYEYDYIGMCVYCMMSVCVMCNFVWYVVGLCMCEYI